VSIATRPDFSALTALVVEDDLDSREFLGAVLRSCGAQVHEADNVQTAKEYVSTLTFNLIVTDLALPGEDGTAFLKWLRQQPHDKSGAAAVVAVTAYYEKYPPSGFSGWAAYFQKPVEMDQFVQTIAAIFHISAGTKASASRG